ncbi:carboxypeptidase regulatory-like domain-containing protein [Streptacidiphilus sp. N1-10]|uniref:Carboxypeptidase regulatory-like domain-containing protein n=2 Tax=Streptacidiphilus jeojiensis TaxID=3229225 RepID=A0ABV6XVT7_9ACTN
MAVAALALAGLAAHPALAAAASSPAGSAVSTAPASSIPTTTETQQSTGRISSQRVCGTPAPGRASCFALKRTDISAVKGVMRGRKVKPAGVSAAGDTVPNTPAGYGPSDLLSAYALPANGGAGATVAIVDAYDDPNAEADLAVYRTQYGLPACTTANGCFKKVDQTGGTGYPAANSGWAGEISLDLDMVSAVAPNAHVVLVEATTASSTDLGTAVDEAVALGAKYVSNSYGASYSSAAGSGEDASEAAAYDPYYDHPGVAVVASSGDSAYGVAYPAASQYVTAVGGTSLTKDATTGRGWAESVWKTSATEGGGSGCSLYEAKPAWQKDTGCAKRSVADVSAVADPATGVAVYQTYGGSGWAVYGGTSASAPIITATYADAGTPVAGSNPASYPYAVASALNDVTTGSNGTCTPAYFCTAGPGYDGPTGLGTPKGLDAFRSGPHGEVRGTVTDSATGQPIAGAAVTVGSDQVVTGSDGSYDVVLAPGTYDVTAGAYGYTSASATGAVVTDGGTLTRDFALDAEARATISGKVTDGSGQGWPLYASISVDGVPGGPVHTDPRTGRYSLSLPVGSAYTLHVTPYYRGYQVTTQQVSLGATNLVQNIQVPIAAGCTAAGYAMAYHGLHQTFDTTATPAGWTVANAAGTGNGWTFTSPTRGNITGGAGGFAIVDSDRAGAGKTQDSYLTAPATDLSAYSADAPPVLSFANAFHVAPNSAGQVQLSTDGGTTWTTVWNSAAVTTYAQSVTLPLPQAAGQSAVEVRFHYTGADSWYWELDNVVLGRYGCEPLTGGLVVGTVSDANTAAAVPGSTIVDAGDAKLTATSATVADPALKGAFYWYFSPDSGDRTVTAAMSRYTTGSAVAAVIAGRTTEADFALKAGQITASPDTVARTAAWGGTASSTVTLKNTGTAAATVHLTDTPTGYSMQGVTAGPDEVPALAVPTSTTSGSELLAARNATPDQLATTRSARQAVQAGVGANTADHWQSVADLPVPLSDNIADTVNGILYTGLGYDGSNDTNQWYAYNPAAQTWGERAPAKDTREGAAHGVVNGKVYVTGGWLPSGETDSRTEVYDPAADAWSTAANAPTAYAGSGSAVLDGKLYTIGGCTDAACGSTAAYAFEPATNTWTQIADYPKAESWMSCGGVGAKVYCAGGVADATGATAYSYAYDPGSNTWSPIALLPSSVWGAATTAANGQLLLQDGIQANNLSNRGYAYDPGTGTWSALPNTPTAGYRFAGALGFYTVGGSTGLGSTSNTAQVLAGWEYSDSVSTDWLSLDRDQLTLQPGESAKVTLTFDAAVPSISQPGTYTASLLPDADTPYPVAAVKVALTVSPPTSWGKIAGTVQYRNADGEMKPVAGATVQITTWTASYTLHTDTAGQYQIWMDTRNNPLTVIAAKDGFVPQTATVKLVRRSAVTKDWTLVQD